MAKRAAPGIMIRVFQVYGALQTPTETIHQNPRVVQMAALAVMMVCQICQVRQNYWGTQRNEARPETVD